MFIDNLVFLEDYRDFAENYLGVDYEDYVQLLNDVELRQKNFELDRELVC